MNSKEARIVRKRYRQAADIYWTKDMEKALRKLRAELATWRIAGPLCAAAGAVLFILSRLPR